MKQLREIVMMIAETVLFIGIVFLVFGIVGGGMVALHIVDAGAFEDTNVIDPYQTLLIDYLPLFVGALVATIVVHTIIFKRDTSFSGFRTEGWFKQFFEGFFWSALLLTVGFVGLYLLGYLQIDKIEMDAYLFLGFILFFLIQSSFEEIAVRSFLLPTIAHRSNTWIGIIASSAVFTLLHIGNANINWLSILNIFLAGLLLGAFFVKYKKIWAPIGLHVGWNFLQGSFFGYEVSGISVYSYLDTQETGPDLLTGGSFGFEGSILASILITILTYIVWRSNPSAFQEPYYHHEKLLV